MQATIPIRTSVTPILADLFTPVSVYLRLRDKFRDSLLLETAVQGQEGGYSFIAINAIGGIEMKEAGLWETKLPGREPRQFKADADKPLAATVEAFMQQFVFEPKEGQARFAQGLYGYTSYELAHHGLPQLPLPQAPELPLLRYRLYQYVLAFHHQTDGLYLLENHVPGVNSQTSELTTVILHRDVPSFQFKTDGEEASAETEQAFCEMVEKGIAHCHRGDVFQIVLSRSFSRCFRGDDFEVYRQLRHLSPTPYLFYFDYGDYKIFGASPESQLLVVDHVASLHPIAGTARRTGDEALDAAARAALLASAKENAEHTMLVDLARNDLSVHCQNVQVARYKELHTYSHVMHLVSEVTGENHQRLPPFRLLLSSFPAGTLSGAPKVRAMQLIKEIERNQRSFYGGTVGFLGADGSCNHAIMIRTVLSKANQLHYRAGAGVVAHSSPEGELQEVNNKLGAIRKAIAQASKTQAL